jgi:hypothetical protein
MGYIILSKVLKDKELDIELTILFLIAYGFAAKY